MASSLVKRALYVLPAQSFDMNSHVTRKVKPKVFLWTKRTFCKSKNGHYLPHSPLVILAVYRLFLALHFLFCMSLSYTPFNQNTVNGQMTRCLEDDGNEGGGGRIGFFLAGGGGAGVRVASPPKTKLLCDKVH